ncbi:hypothetical protein BGZ92_011704 [Podila epicladia]|nr:hypothetical protein BGZ92_011704 [Podila epicladia]
MKHIAFPAFVFLALLVSSSVHAVVNVAAWAAYAAITAAQGTAIGVAIPTAAVMAVAFLQAFNRKRKQENLPEIIYPEYGFRNADPNIILNTDCDLLPADDYYVAPKEGETENCRFFAIADHHYNKKCLWSAKGDEEQEFILPLPYSAKMLYLYDYVFYEDETGREYDESTRSFVTKGGQIKCVEPYPVPQGQVTGLTKDKVLHVFNDCESYKELYNNYIDDRCKSFFPTPPE